MTSPQPTVVTVSKTAPAIAPVATVTTTSAPSPVVAYAVPADSWSNHIWEVILIIVIALVVLAVIGYLLYIWYKNRTPTNPTPPAPTNIQVNPNSDGSYTVTWANASAPVSGKPLMYAVSVQSAGPSPIQVANAANLTSPTFRIPASAIKTSGTYQVNIGSYYNSSGPTSSGSTTFTANPTNCRMTAPSSGVQLYSNQGNVIGTYNYSGTEQSAIQNCSSRCLSDSECQAYWLSLQSVRPSQTNTSSQPIPISRNYNCTLYNTPALQRANATTGNWASFRQC